MARQRHDHDLGSQLAFLRKEEKGWRDAYHRAPAQWRAASLLELVVLTLKSALCSLYLYLYL